MQDKTILNSTGCGHLTEPSELQRYRNYDSLSDGAKFHAYFAFVWQICAFILGCGFMKDGNFYNGALVFSLGLVVGGGYALAICTKIHPSRLFWWFLCGVALLGSIGALSL